MIELNDMSVLIADDVEAMCKSIRSMLKILHFGKKIHFAYNGQQALEILKQESVDLIISDLKMPVMDGIEFLDRIRSDKLLRDKPVIMITNEATSEIVAEAAESDIDAYILKPVTVKMLDEKVRSVIDKSNNPSPMESHLKTARMFEEFGDIDMAIEEAELAMKTDKYSSKPLRTLGYYHCRKEEWNKAEDYLLRATKINHLDVFAFHHLGQLYLHHDDVDKAAKFFEMAMEISPRNIARALDFGKILVKKRKLRKARGVFKKIIERPTIPTVLKKDIAEFCFDNKFYDYAAHLFKLMLEQTPYHPYLNLKLGLACYELKDFDNALKYLLKVERHIPGDIDLLLRIAKIYILKNRIILADTFLKKVLEVDPDNEEAKVLMIKNI